MNRPTKFWHARGESLWLWIASLLAAMALAAALAVVSFAPAWADGPAATLESGSRLWLEGNSTLHRYESTASRFEVRVEAAQGLATAGPEGLEQLVKAGSVKTVEVTIPVAAMQSGKSGLDKNMRSALKADRFPNITFHLERYTVGASRSSDSLVIEAHGMLTVAGVEKPVDLHAGAVRSADALRIRGTKELQMTDFGVKPPTMMMGAVKTSNEIVIQFDLLLAPNQSNPLVGVKGE